MKTLIYFYPHIISGFLKKATSCFFILFIVICRYMSQDRLFKLACTECKRINYWSSKNKKLVTKKIELNKFCKWCKKNTKHKEVKK